LMENESVFRGIYVFSTRLKYEIFQKSNIGFDSAQNQIKTS